MARWSIRLYRSNTTNPSVHFDYLASSEGPYQSSYAKHLEYLLVIDVDNSERTPRSGCNSVITDGRNYVSSLLIIVLAIASWRQGTSQQRVRECVHRRLCWTTSSVENWVTSVASLFTTNRYLSMRTFMRARNSRATNIILLLIGRLCFSEQKLFKKCALSHYECDSYSTRVTYSSFSSGYNTTSIL